MKSTRRITLPKHKQAAKVKRRKSRRELDALFQRQEDTEFMKQFVVYQTHTDFAGRIHKTPVRDTSLLNYRHHHSTVTLRFCDRPQLLRILWEYGYSPKKAAVYNDPTLRRLIEKARAKEDEDTL